MDDATAKVPTPTLDKLSACLKERNAIVQFLEWLESEQRIELARYHKHTKECGDEDEAGYLCGCSTERLYPANKRFESLAHKFLEIDEVKAEDERQAILASLRG